MDPLHQEYKKNEFMLGLWRNGWSREFIDALVARTDETIKKDRVQNDGAPEMAGR